MVARSNVEAEYKVVAKGTCELMWIKRLLGELRMMGLDSVKLYYDNQATISIAHNLVHYDQTKHVEVDQHFIKLIDIL